MVEITSRARDSRGDGAKPSYLGVVVDDSGIAEWEDGQKIIFLPRAEILEIRRQFGWRSERPIVRALLGALLLLPGLFVLPRLLLALSHLRHDQAIAAPKITIAIAVILPLLGGWALGTAFARGNYLRVLLSGGDSRKLVFRGRFDDNEFARFADQAREAGYTILG